MSCCKACGYVDPEDERPDLTSEQVVNIVNYQLCKDFNIPKGAMESSSRKRHVAEPRQMAMFLVYSCSNLTQYAIGQIYGGRTHATVLHSIRNIADLIDMYPSFKNKINNYIFDLKLDDSIRRFKYKSV